MRTDEARAALAAVEIDLADATTEAQVGNPKARRRALEWQAVLQAADG
ncbi:MAG: hypothetical protein GY929_27445 [Actinomycetia bacterium]|nr:hypothetical protein [Actinomycetes bacterium]MCP5030020.1 hypothetical protein [Actinomycetes bacterium]